MPPPMPPCPTGSTGNAQADAMLKALKALTADSNGPVRESAAKVFWQVHAQWPAAADTLKAKMEPAQLKLLKRVQPR